MPFLLHVSHKQPEASLVDLELSIPTVALAAVSRLRQASRSRG